MEPPPCFSEFRRHAPSVNTIKHAGCNADVAGPTMVALALDGGGCGCCCCDAVAGTLLDCAAVVVGDGRIMLMAVFGNRPIPKCSVCLYCNR